MKKKAINKKLSFKVKDVSALSDTAAAAIKGGATSPNCTENTCISDCVSRCGRDRQTRCLPIP
ncbi:hypothetical protein HHL16_08125 [Pseudoflavitalea sp. G-6-1-2]|nr:hypothetical protein [Pseudoflavitalea sp. G-6-1-2]